MNRVRAALLIMFAITLVGLRASATRAQDVEPQAAPLGAELGSGFSYQGQLKRAGQLVNATCDFQFSLYDSATAGAQAGQIVTKTGVIVTDGTFAAKLDFGKDVFAGEARWLQTAVKCPGDEGFILFSMRQELTPAPYAIGLMPGAMVRSTQLNVPALTTESSGHDGLIARTTRAGYAGIFGSNLSAAGGRGVYGYNKGPDGHAVYGFTEQGTGVTGETLADNRAGVYGNNKAGGAGVFGRGERGDGVIGEARQTNRSGVFGNNLSNGPGVTGNSDKGAGVVGTSQTWIGVFGKSTTLTGVHGESVNASGVVGVSTRGVGVWAKSNDSTGVHGESVNGTGVYGFSQNGYAGDFNGRTRVKVLEITGGADLAEPFDVAAVGNIQPRPGAVVCIDPANPGKLIICSASYSATVAGIISGAGDVQPGMIMGQHGSIADGQHPVAMTGRVYVWVDASVTPVQPGDLLTSADLPGFAAKASDPTRAHGTIIGKAMTALPSGQGLVLVLVGLK